MASETRHVCGLMGFNPMKGDNCPACETPHPPREAPTPTDADRLREFVRQHSTGGCRVLSQDDACQCPLCCIDRLESAIDDEDVARTVETLTRLRASGSGTTTAGAPRERIRDAWADVEHVYIHAGPNKAWIAAAAALWKQIDAALSSPPGPSEARESSG
jgi:hypothetical protein